MYITTKNFKRKCKINIEINGQKVTLFIDPKIDFYEGRNIYLNEIAIDAPKEVKFSVEKGENL